MSLTPASSRPRGRRTHPRSGNFFTPIVIRGHVQVTNAIFSLHLRNTRGGVLIPAQAGDHERRHDITPFPMTRVTDERHSCTRHRACLYWGSPGRHAQHKAPGLPASTGVPWAAMHIPCTEEDGPMGRQGGSGNPTHVVG